MSATAKNPTESLLSSSSNGNDNSVEEDSADALQYDRSLAHEAERVAAEIRFGVETASVSTLLERSETLAHLNIRTKEGADWCVELSLLGYMVVGRAFDTVDAALRDENADAQRRCETVEALMHQISPRFVSIFNNSVAAKLERIVD